MNAKVNYLMSSIKKRVLSQGNECPSCGSNLSKIVERKFLVTNLRRCEVCNLLFRTPTTTESENFDFYQEDYEQGFTTELPTEAELKELTNIKFKNTEKDYSVYINILKSINSVPGQKLLDYGCSWGYGSWQLQQAGYEVTSFEVSQFRRQYARENLGVDVKSSLEDIKGQFDIIFSSHVIEHLPSVSEYLEFAKNHLKPTGLLVTISPNGSECFKSSDPQTYTKFWGLVHPQFLDEKFYLQYFQNSSLLLASNPYDYSLISSWDKKSLCIGNLSGDELLSIWSKS